MKTELLRQLEASDHEKVFVLASTNCPWDLDAAFLRRFQQRVYIPLPDRLVPFNILFYILLIQSWLPRKMKISFLTSDIADRR